MFFFYKNLIRIRVIIHHLQSHHSLYVPRLQSQHIHLRHTCEYFHNLNKQATTAFRSGRGFTATTAERQPSPPLCRPPTDSGRECSHPSSRNVTSHPSPISV
jgi:hypothetical protein